MTRLLGERLSGFFALMMKNKKTKKTVSAFSRQTSDDVVGDLQVLPRLDDS